MAPNNNAPKPASSPNSNGAVTLETTNSVQTTLQLTGQTTLQPSTPPTSAEAFSIDAAAAEELLEQSSTEDDIAVTQPQKSPTGLMSWWTLKNKATLLAVALGTIPVLIVGGISTSIASRQLAKEAIGKQQQTTNAIALQLQDFGSAQKAADSSEDNTGGSLSAKILNDTEINNLSALVNQRINSLRPETNGEDNTLRVNVIDNKRNNSILISNSQTDLNTSIDRIFPEYANLQEDESAKVLEATSTEDNKPYLLTYTPVQDTSGLDNNLSVLVYQPMTEVFAAQQNLRRTLLGGTILTALLVSTLAAYLANKATQPIIAASKAVEKLGKGKFNTRLPVQSSDELGVLNSNINVMAEQLEYQIEFIQETAQRQNLFQTQAFLARQQQEKREALQRDLSEFTQLVEQAAQGNLTVRAKPIDGEIGLLADVFNQITENLQQVVAQAKRTAWHMNAAIGPTRDSIQQLSEGAIDQTFEVSQVCTTLETIASSMEIAADEAKLAEQISQKTSALAGKSNQDLAESARSIVDWRGTVAEITHKVKQLDIATHQISQVISLINEIALKTNLLAINASIETKQSVKEEQGIASVASEIGQLSEQSTRATGEIERIVRGIQSETKEIVGTLEGKAAQAIDKAAERSRAQENAANLIEAVAELEELMRSLVHSTTAQTSASQIAAQQLQQVSADLQQTSEISKQASSALQDTLEASQALSSSVDSFKI